MPKVGKKEFPYTKAGIAAAKKAAKSSGKKMSSGKKPSQTRKNNMDY